MLTGIIIGIVVGIFVAAAYPVPSETIRVLVGYGLRKAAAKANELRARWGL